MDDDMYNKILVGLIIFLLVVNLIVNIAYLNKKSKDEKTENYCGCNNGSSQLMSYNNSNTGCNISLIGFWQTANGNGSTLSFLQEGQVISQNRGEAGVLYMYACPENSMYGSIYNKEISVQFLLQDESTLFVIDPERGQVEYKKIPSSPIMPTPYITTSPSMPSPYITTSPSSMPYSQRLNRNI